MAEEIDLGKKPSAAAKEKPKDTPYQEDEGSSSEDDQEAADAPDKAARKKQLKQEKRDKRRLKKELKLAFKSQNGKLVKATTAELGQLRVGVSVKKIY